MTAPLPEPLPADPLPVVKSWMDEAAVAIKNSGAMTLATTTPDGRPAARMIMCRGFDATVGFLVFYSDRLSPKGRDLEGNPRASVVFYWDALDRQVRIDGPVTAAPDADADRYWASRPADARIAALVSEQSAPIESRAALVRKFETAAKELGPDVRRPQQWIGYRVWAERVELWVSQPARLHDRAVWSRSLTPLADGFAGGPWSSTRLQP